ncbi:MAG: SHOCT domain-containing protein [Candidatus Woesearchaeota archaeon]
MMHYMSYGGMMGGGLFGWFGLMWTVLFWAAVIWFIVWIVKNIKNRTAWEESPLDILKKRYAKGEITKRQYEEMRKEL